MLPNRLSFCILMSMDLQGIRVTKSTETHRTLASITNEIKISSGFLGHSFDPAKMNGLTSPHDEGKRWFPFHSGLFMTLKITPSLLGFLHSVSPNSILAFFCLCFICIPVFGGSKPNVSLHCNRRFERLGRLPRRSPTDQDSKLGQVGGLRRTFR